MLRTAGNHATASRTFIKMVYIIKVEHYHLRL